MDEQTMTFLASCRKASDRMLFILCGSPCQRGTNENTNQLLRQYFPRRTDLSGYAQSDLDKVALRLNQRLRKTLGFETPASRLRASVALTLLRPPFHVQAFIAQPAVEAFDVAILDGFARTNKI